MHRHQKRTCNFFVQFRFNIIQSVFFFLVSGPVEADPEYLLIVEANDISAEIDNEISKCKSESEHFNCSVKYEESAELLAINFVFVLIFNIYSFMSTDIIHKYVRDVYSKRFPELESLVPGALEYIGTVRELGNDLEGAKNNEVLSQILTPATIMVVSVTVSTTQG